ncbi:coiled-coil domain-containing protein 87 [Python bivittatus]|uniref:Coiled-coil domain-containing protein 87 n=1 Tax=Python bivittatus TaxID=176946 RepID=A0A9F5IHC8_PYTBI|nr:coiled-coil domain-containing protein 87 [Python bivittatus]
MASSASPPERPLYALEDTRMMAQQLHEQYQRIMTPLSLFPTSYTKVKPSSSHLALSPPSQEEVPVPISLSALLQLVRARLQPGPQEARAHPQHLRAFRDIILTEVKHAFKDLQRLLHDPAFSADTNRELYQHLLTYIGLVSKHLFRHYVGLMECCRLRGIFTDCANLIRFSAQLSLDCSKFLNVADVRQRLVWEMKKLTDHQLDSLAKSSSPFGPMTTRALGSRLGITICYFIRHIRPHVLTEKEKIAQDVKELEELPLLDMSKIKKLNLPTPRKVNFLEQMSCAAVTTPCFYSASGVRSRSQQFRPSTVFLRSQSLPNMRVGKLLADELGIHLTPRRITPDLLCCYTESPEDVEFRGPEALAEDLQRLVQGSILENSQWKGEQDNDLDLPPLIKALTWSKANETRQLQLQRMLQSLQQEERFEMKRRNTIIAAPASHPQATTVNVKVHDGMVVKAADLQVSERHYSETVTMDRSLPIYNHLLGEISPATMKSLDANLYTGEDVKEIYKELMNTIPKDHLKFDQGPLIELPAATLDRHSCFASSTLTKKKNEQIINTELSKILPAGPFIPEEVVDSPQTASLPRKKLASKQYASWLKWWKATFSTDEYLKYISNSDSDYLPVIFHLYNPKEDNEDVMEKDVQSMLNEAEVKKQKGKRKELKAAELQSQKEQFHTGFWNTTNVRLEGPEALLTCDHKLEDLSVLQRRLERLWTVLHFSERERLDMAIKYSSNQYYFLLPDMLNSWEIAAQLIQDRELLLAEIEEFEQTASDPNRLFSKEQGSFATRIQESKIRSHLSFELDQYNLELHIILKHIKDAFNDTVTFKGRPYLDKMERDIVEMLYWLQQERRAIVLKRAVQKGSQRRLSPLP